jgi:hypothetical protein
MPARVSDRVRARITVGLAKLAELVNQYADDVEDGIPLRRPGTGHLLDPVGLPGGLEGAGEGVEVRSALIPLRCTGGPVEGVRLLIVDPDVPVEHVQPSVAGLPGELPVGRVPPAVADSLKPDAVIRTGVGTR